MHPDWSMIGFRSRGVYCIAASSNLSRARLEARTSILRDIPLSEQKFNSIRYKVLLEMDDVVLVEGSSYAEALQMLFQFWRPEESTQKVQEIDVPGINQIDQ